MRFALLGDRPDGLAMAAALVASGRHELAAYTTANDALSRLAPAARKVADAEEVLADPAVEAVIAAGGAGALAAQLTSCVAVRAPRPLHISPRRHPRYRL